MIPDSFDLEIASQIGPDRCGISGKAELIPAAHFICAMVKPGLERVQGQLGAVSTRCIGRGKRYTDGG